ncbi:MAG: hypothetical protein HYU78_08210 [Rhodocyclales bacterium]|nr:hypothetical protein [Rhodocyclales bacterium]
MHNHPAHSIASAPILWLLALSAPLFQGCNTLAVTMLGVGANIGISHQISGYASKTFVRPLPDILDAAEAALGLMEIGVFTIDAHGDNRTIWAYAGDLSIEIELDALTPTTTRMRVIARRSIGVLVDASTAQAITLETETQLRRAQAAAKAPAPP